MKTWLPRRIWRFTSKIGGFLQEVLQTLLPLRTPGKLRPKTSGLLAINQRRIFSRTPFTYTEDQTFAFFSYKEKAVKKCIWDFKYYFKAFATEQFADILADELVSHLSDTIGNIPFNSPTLLTYCPSSSFASGKKAKDHMHELVLKIERGTQSFVHICTGAIVISKKAESQHFGNMAERQMWAKERFSLSTGFKGYIKTIPAVKIICVDDIITTGSTLKAVKNIFNSEDFDLEFFALCFTELSK